ncbi:putative SAC6-actin filament bundling protein, fimbrin [Tilletiaria anomala UBC 951]|uniref:Fimbrin n=1 Tax=Tilletiaria anomala (strain ATCC 24038 / CBS 436.72 / UBC 951) TaxID=1037660 RepID=A0A066VK39_TILAU|nr:putative SAC6-actin filament bundling protein, fimbrin [Tilletiaria anomala UBC 951]KDN38930.1 putative SAC6-actin filament bundling protein, fimbrin [Tilletiaria anomala UBC 951]
MEAIKLQRKYPQFSQEEMMGLISKFRAIDVEENGSVARQDVIKAMEESKEASYDQVRETLKEVAIDSSGRVELDDFVDLMAKLRAGRNVGAGVVTKGKVTVKGANASTQHTINEDERSEFTRHINSNLSGDPTIGNRLPIPMDTFQLFDECRDGLILCKLINDAVPDTIDERVLNIGKGTKPPNAFQMTENNNIVITSAKAIGCSVVNIGPQDLIDGREHLILGLIWQIIRRGLLSKIDLKNHPELYRLLEDDETLEDFLRLPPDQILLRWFNYHLKAANWNRRVNNFSKDVSDGENYTVLLSQLKPESCDRRPLQERDPHQRAEMVLQRADAIGCRKYLTPGAMVAGNPKLNLAFVAHLFNTWPCLEPLEEAPPVEIEDFDAEGEREARVFTLWLNSLDVDPGVYNLFEDLKDGTIILQAFDKVVPGSVIWKRVSKPKDGQDLSRFKMVENTNYAVDLAKANDMRIVGIQGADIVDGTKTLVLGLVWQLMRLNISKTLASLGKSGKGVSDVDMVQWANGIVKAAGKTSNMRSFKDPGLKNAVFFLDLLDALRKGIVDYSLVTQGCTEEECKMNAKLAISIARKLGALIFLVPEDIVELRQRLILTFVGSLMSLQA